MCLEDRLLLALYDQEGFTALPLLASRVSLTEGAVRSIVHRITSDHPEFVLLHGEEPLLLVSPNKQTEKAVKDFMKNGGYTAINEEEFRKYFSEELSLFNRLQRLKEDVAQKAWVKWTSITVLSTAVVAALSFYLRTPKSH